MKSLLPAAAIAAMICTALVTLTAAVFCMAMGANSSPSELRVLKLWMAGLSLLGAGGIVAGILLMRAGQHGWAVGAALIPVAIMFIIFIGALIIK
ncbi:MAG: hypothetical protein ABIZ81_02430 [Opitutaceae bacterium]